MLYNPPLHARQLPGLSRTQIKKSLQRNNVHEVLFVDDRVVGLPIHCCAVIHYGADGSLLWRLLPSEVRVAVVEDLHHLCYCHFVLKLLNRVNLQSLSVTLIVSRSRDNCICLDISWLRGFPPDCVVTVKGLIKATVVSHNRTLRIVGCATMLGASFNYQSELDNAKMRLQKLKEKLKLRAMIRRGEFSGQQDQDASKAFDIPGGIESAETSHMAGGGLPQIIARLLLGQGISLPLDSQALQNKVGYSNCGVVTLLCS
jgi:hypothetical protein